MWPRTSKGAKKHMQRKRTLEIKVALDCIRRLPEIDSKVTTEIKILEFGSGNGFQAIDVLTHPDYRGQGIYKAIMKEVIAEAGNNGAYFGFSFPTKTAHSIVTNLLLWLLDIPDKILPLARIFYISMTHTMKEICIYML